MAWYAYVLIAFLALGSALNILHIGKPREPITAGMALAICVVNGLMIWAIVELATR